MVLLHTPTILENNSEVNLSIGISLIGCLSVPTRCLGLVLLHTLTEQYMFMIPRLN